MNDAIKFVRACDVNLDADQLREVEAAYRRGYQQGAYAAISAINEGGDATEVEAWVLIDLFNWRHEEHGGSEKFPPIFPETFGR